MAYVIVAGVFVGVSYWMSPRNIWSAIGPVLGGSLGRESAGALKISTR